MNNFTIYIQDNNGDYTYKEVEADSSENAIFKTFGDGWRKLSNNEIPKGVYKTGTYSFEKGYLTVKTPSTGPNISS